LQTRLRRSTHSKGKSHIPVRFYLILETDGLQNSIRSTTNCLVAMASTTATHLKQVFVLPANAFQAQCPQNPAALGTQITSSTAAQLYSTKDCLFLSVHATANASCLPVLFEFMEGLQCRERTARLDCNQCESQQFCKIFRSI
jgi:hypothetical protein